MPAVMKISKRIVCISFGEKSAEGGPAVDTKPAALIVARFCDVLLKFRRISIFATGLANEDHPMIVELA